MSISCENATRVHEDGHPAVSTLMFAGGVVGNLLALGILGVHRRERRARASPFWVLVTGLAVTDLLGTCILSPMVFVSYAQQSSILALGAAPLCHLFAFAMTFFSLASMMLLFCMALERCLAISHPYVYAQHSWGHRLAHAAIPVSYVLGALLCALPLVGVGEHKQYCPGTWCFIRMTVPGHRESGALAFSLLYASLTGLLIVAIVICNTSVTASLCRMRKGQKARRGSLRRCGARGWLLGAGEEELEHLILLVLMTVIFMVCTVPLTLRAFLGAIYEDDNESADLLAFRFSAFNPILDPWIFIIFRGSVFRKLRSLLCSGWSHTNKPTSVTSFLEPSSPGFIPRSPELVPVGDTCCAGNLKKERDSEREGTGEREAALLPPPP
ncbi:prostacyclin receptor [Xenopus tropicalis]|uniref:Prostacyclin receptor n=1 Tax=Xenopus tropicalis TaxID=8364 RepID=F7C401_XENTR|nr:prostacyclin receptor [Xenopus tropicalis]|eukprot:XP_002932677.1 PREDICTED: prostacyclin receptor [Xenopus tropicalis]